MEEREFEKASSPKVGEGAFILLHKFWPLEGCLIPATPEVPPGGPVLPVLSSSSVKGLRKSPLSCRSGSSAGRAGTSGLAVVPVSLLVQLPDKIQKLIFVSGTGSGSGSGSIQR